MDEATIRINDRLVRLAQETIVDWAYQLDTGWVDRMATQTTTKMPVQFPLRPKPIKTPKKGGK